MKTKDTKIKKVKREMILKPAHIHFVYLFLGAEDGSCFNNATLSYIKAYNIDTVLEKVNDGTGKMDYTGAYKGAKTNGHKLLTNTNIKKLKDKILLEAGFKPETIKKRYSELAYQNSNLGIALASTDRIAKIVGILKQDTNQVNIPQLEELTKHIKKILS